MAFIEGVPTVEIVLDKSRRLGFTMGAMKRIKAQAGTLELPIGEDGKIPLDKAIDLIPIYIWACLDAPDREELSVERLMDMIHPGNIPAISEAVVGLLQSSVPEGSKGPGPTLVVPDPVAATG